MSLLQAGLIDLAIVGSFFLMGWALLRALGVRSDRLAALSLGMPLGGGVFTWLLFLLSWAGVRLCAPTLGVSYSVLLAALLAVGLARDRPPFVAGSLQEVSPSPRAPRQGLPAVALSLLVVVLVVGAMILAVGLSYHTWDAIANWSVAGYGIALEGSAFAPLRWGSAGLNYPLNIQLMISIFRMLDGDIVPGSTLLFPLFYALLLLGCYRFLRRQGIDRTLVLLGVVLIGSTPLIFTHANMGYTNLPMTHYLVMGLLWGIEAVDEGSRVKARVAGFLVALAGWTRPEGFILGVAVGVSLGVGAFLARRKRKPLTALLPPFLTAAVLWGVFYSRYSGGEVEAISDTRMALLGLSQGIVHWEAFYTIARYFAGQVLRFREWGLFFPAVVLLLVTGLRPRMLVRDFRSVTLAIAAAVLGVLVVAAHYVAAYSPRGPGFVYDWMALEFNRVFMPVGLTLALLSILEFGKRIRSERAS